MSLRLLRPFLSVFLSSFCKDYSAILAVKLAPFFSEFLRYGTKRTASTGSGRQREALKAAQREREREREKGRLKERILLQGKTLELSVAEWLRVTVKGCR